jgi:hypothetical protein
MLTVLESALPALTNCPPSAVPPTCCHLDRWSTPRSRRSSAEVGLYRTLGQVSEKNVLYRSAGEPLGRDRAAARGRSRGSCPRSRAPCDALRE